MIRYGRLPHDPGRVAGVAPHALGDAAIPAAYPARAIAAWTPTLADNTELPTCTVAGLANSARRWVAAQGFDFPVVDQKLLDLYAAVGGCAPTPEAIAGTNGLVMLDLLQYVALHGFDYGGQTPLALMAHRVDPTDLDAIRDAIRQRQSAYIGVDLYASDVAPGAVWRGAAKGQPEGGHCIVACRFGPDEWDEATWGELWPADDAWMASRVREVYALEWSL